MIKLVQKLQDCILALQSPAAEPPWKRLSELVAHVGSSWDSKDVVEFFEGALLCVWHPEEDAMILVPAQKPKTPVAPMVSIMS